MKRVSEEFGDWEDIRMLSEEYPLMFDYMINHISAHSPYYQDFLEKKGSVAIQRIVYPL